MLGMLSIPRSPRSSERKRFKFLSKKSLSQLRAHITPALQTLELTDHDRFITDLTIFPFAAAKKVAFVRWSLTFEESLYILSKCHSATEIFLEASNNTTPSLPPGPIDYITLNNLTNLDLSSVVHPMELLRRLTLPRLENLKILDGVGGYWYYKSPEMPAQIMEDFLARSKCPLRALSIEDFTIMVEEVVRFLKIPAVREIRMVEFKFAHVLERTERLLISCGEGERVDRRGEQNGGVNGGSCEAGDEDGQRRRTMLEGVNFKVWTQRRQIMGEDNGEDLEQERDWGQCVGWKDLDEEEDLLMEYRNGKLCSGWEFLIMTQMQ